ncbi:hypothetical protein FOQG_10730 [Fusarium oxysporum f. sp. raphani 54005]|uniref:Uncharacterized protein n=2 Tax=Fusarium oxysporum f. sp. raphani TaxID=96318 RepID=X0CS79_FUSOX|nr:hypothetical protein FOQG_10730 [Fusarium oxysporum f. sp. raphani 54005]KAG7437924.1 hypothetical protein Forpi1262_v000181 [Fusarium oxysporum f. sp. raphani]KAJ4018911.1 hypothetical protein NW758_014949 [Fusarium oxysporum]KAJ4076812.1 hypothetical protein NW761_012350 [Fusarium oxysporum]
MQQISQGILQNAHTIAKKHKLLYIKDMDDQIYFKMRSGTPTLLVVAPWSSEKTPIWEKAVEGDIHVEIITPELRQTIYFGASNDASLHGNWDWVRAKVHDCLQSFQATRDRLTLIALFQYGVIPDPKGNPLTIYISADFDLDETCWHEGVVDIKNMLQGVEGWGYVQVHMGHNEGWQDLFD